MLNDIFSQFNTFDNQPGDPLQTEFKSVENAEEEKTNFALDTFAKFGLNVDLLNPNLTDEDSGMESMRTKDGQARSSKVELLIHKMPDFGFLVDDKLAMDDLFV